MKINSQTSRDFVVYGGAILVWALTVSGCAAPKLKPMHTLEPERPASAEARPAPTLAEIPYGVKGETHFPIQKTSEFQQEGLASWYGKKFHGRLTANQEVYNMNALTAAHKTLPFNTRVKVVNLDNGREVVVRINDRGPFVKDRIIDLSYQAGQELGILKQGMARVRLSIANAPSASKASGGAEKGYTIQLGVFKNQENAKQVSRQIADGRIQTFSREDIQFHRVLAGSFHTFEEAVERMEEIQGQGSKDAFIIIEP